MLDEAIKFLWPGVAIILAFASILSTVKNWAGLKITDRKDSLSLACYAWIIGVLIGLMFGFLPSTALYLQFSFVTVFLLQLYFYPPWKVLVWRHSHLELLAFLDERGFSSLSDIDKPSFATKDEVDNCIRSVPMVKSYDATAREEILRTIRDDMHQAKVLISKPLQSSFEFNPDTLFIDPSKGSVVKRCICTDVRTKWQAKKFDTLVWIARGPTLDLTSTLFFKEQLARELEISPEHVVAFKVGDALNNEQEMFRRCKNKRVLLVEPFMFDRQLDAAYSHIVQKLKGQVEGVLIIFQSGDIDFRLDYEDAIRGLSRYPSLEGQIVLNLKFEDLDKDD